MRAAENAGADQELAHDLSAGEPEGLLEQLQPLRLGERMVRRQPGVKTAVTLLKCQNSFRVGDGRVHLEPIADDAGIAEQAALLVGAVAGHPCGVEAVVGLTKGFPFLENREPRETGLVDLEHQPLEQLGVTGKRKSVFGVVIRAVPLVAGSDVAVGRHGQAGRRAGGPAGREVQSDEHPRRVSSVIPSLRSG
jgi:hypothetical protein